MKHLFSTRLLYSILLYVLCLALFIINKPKFIYNEYGELITFGVGNQKTILPLGVVVVILSLLSFYTFAIIDIFVIKK